MKQVTMTDAQEFDRSLSSVLVHEGGYSNNPHDPGGATMKGVTQRVYDDYRDSKGLAHRSVKLISRSELLDIYRRRYWDLIKGDDLPHGLSYVVFDGAVNSGQGRSAKWLQASLKALGLYTGALDGLIGPGTLKAVAQVNDVDALIASICARRMAFLKRLKHWKHFKNGWTNRVNGVLKTGQAWATGSVGPQLEYVEGGAAKAFESEIKSAPAVAPGDIATGAGVSSGGLAATLNEVKEQLVSVGGGSDFVNRIIIGLTLAGAVLVIAGVAYRLIANWRRARRVDDLDLEVA